MSQSASDSRHKLIGSLLIFGAASLFGFHAVLIKTAFANGVNVAQVFFFAFSISFLFFGIIGRLTQKEPIRPTRRQWVLLVVAGVFGAGGTGLFLFWSYSYIPVALTLTLLFLYVPWVFLWEFLLMGKKPNGRQWMAIGLIMVGVVCGTNLTGINWEEIHWLGILFGLLSGVSYSWQLVLTHKVAHVGTPVFRSMVFSGSALAVAIPIGIIFPLGMFRPTIPWMEFLVLIVMLSALGQLFPQWAYAKGVPMIGSAVAGILASIELPTAVFLSALILKESVASIQWIGVTLVVIAIAVANWPARKMPDGAIKS